MKTVTAPDGFTDRTPHRGPWLSPDSPPEIHTWDIQVLLEDGTTSNAVVMPAGWWVRTVFRSVLGWRKLDAQPSSNPCHVSLDA